MIKHILAALVVVITIFFLSVSFSPGKTRNNIPYTDSFAEERLKYMKEVLASINGKQKMNTDSVFKNIQLFKGTKNFTAEHFLLMMNIGWGKGLGVSCTYCHIPGKWESDEKPAKQIAREMYGIRQMINTNWVRLKACNRHSHSSIAVPSPRRANTKQGLVGRREHDVR